MKLSKIRSADRNPKNHSVALLNQSMSRFGVAELPLLDERTGKLVAGHGRLKALREMHEKGEPAPKDVTVVDGEWLVPVQRGWASKDDAAASAYLLASNKTTELGGWDSKELDALLVELGADQLTGTGFDASDLLEEHDKDVDAEPQIDRAEELRKEWSVELGQLWELGSHRLLCGSSTKSDDVARVMGVERADICFTSPPYNAGTTITDGKHPNKYQNDDDERSGEDYLALLVDFTTAALSVSDFVFVNLQSIAGNKRALIAYLHAMSDRYADTIIWDKMTAEPAMASNVLNSRFEYVHVFSQKANRAIGAVPFRGTLENIVEINSRQGKEFSAIHKATFPVQLPSHFVSLFCRKGECVLEPFSGSGTTLIACEQLGMKCRAIELSPGYVAVTLQRFKDATGKTPRLVEGKKHEQVKHEQVK